MRLLLLPGLNGSSRLFAPLLAQLGDLPCSVLELPNQGPQGHDHLANALHDQLGETPFVLLGESFSGPLAFRLALRHPNALKGMILAASFLRPPNPLLPLACRLPLPGKLPAPAWLLRWFCIEDAAPAVLQLLQNEIRHLSPPLVRERLQAMARLQNPLASLSLPTLHLWPTHDRLVGHAAAASIGRHCRDLRVTRIEGPHFLLQSRPRDCAQAIQQFMAELGETA
jgi:pimeloyl-ACP methyl ester carboxylesterase